MSTTSVGGCCARTESRKWNAVSAVKTPSSTMIFSPGREPSNISSFRLSFRIVVRSLSRQVQNHIANGTRNLDEARGATAFEKAAIFVVNREASKNCDVRYFFFRREEGGRGRALDACGSSC